MKKRMIPVVALSALICLGGLATITSCSIKPSDDNTGEVTEAKVTITSTVSKVKVGEEITLTCEVTGTTDTAVTWSVNSGEQYLELVDATSGKFKGKEIGTAKVKVALNSDPTKSAIVSITVTAATEVDPDAIATIETVTKTAKDQFVETTIQGTLVSLYQEGTAYSGLIYDGTAVMPLYKFASNTQAGTLKIGDVLKVKGTPSRYKDYYWAQFDGGSGNITKWDVVADGTKNELPAAINWTGADATAYAEENSSDFKHVVCDVIAVKSGNYTNFKIIGSSDTDRLLGLQYTPSDAAYCVEGTKSRMEFVTGDLKNSETIVSVYPINIELKGLSLTAEKTEIKVGSSTTLSLLDGETPITENITWSSSDDTIATVANGVVTGVKEGTATISAKYGENTVTIDIKVLSAVIDYVSEATAKTITEANVDGLDSSELYIVEGIISKVDANKVKYGEFYMTADGAEAEGDASLYVRNSCFGQEALSNNGKEWSYNYKNGYSREDFYTVGQKVKILCFRADYTKNDVTTKQVKGVILTDDPYWLAKKATVDEVLEGDLDASKLYFTEAYVTSIEKVGYGRFHASAKDDGTGTNLYVYSSGFYNNDPTALSQKDDSTWNYDFNKATVPSETTLTVGDKVTLVVYRADHTKDGVTTKKVKGVIYDIEAGDLKTPEAPEEVPEGYTSVVKYDFASSKAGSGLDAAQAKSYLNSVSDEKDDKLISGVTTATNIYQGNTNGGPGKLSCLKFGASDGTGELSFTTTAKIGMIKLSYFTWSTSKATTFVINGTEITETSADYVTPIEKEVAFKEASNNITISTKTKGDKRACVLSMRLYTVAK